MRTKTLLRLGLLALALALALAPGFTWANSVGGIDVAGDDPDDTDCGDDDDNPSTPPVDTGGDPCEDDGANFGMPSFFVGSKDCPFSDNGPAEADADEFLNCLKDEAETNNDDPDLTITRNANWGIDLTYPAGSGKVLEWICYYEANEDLDYAAVRTDADDLQAKIRKVEDSTLFDPEPQTITLTLQPAGLQDIVIELPTSPKLTLNTRLKNAIVAAGFSAEFADDYINVSQYDSVPPRGIAKVALESEDPGIAVTELALVGAGQVGDSYTACTPAP